MRTDSHGILPGLRRLQSLIAIHPCANQVERLECNLLTELEALLDFDDRALVSSRTICLEVVPASQRRTGRVQLTALENCLCPYGAIRFGEGPVVLVK